MSLFITFTLKKITRLVIDHSLANECVVSQHKPSILKYFQNGLLFFFNEPKWVTGTGNWAGNGSQTSVEPEAFLQPQQSDRTQLWCTSTQASFFWPRSYAQVLFCPCNKHVCLYCCSSSGLWVSSNWQNNSCLSSTCHFSLFFINLKTLLLISVCMDTFLCGLSNNNYFNVATGSP